MATQITSVPRASELVRRIHRALSDRIAAGEFAPGERLPGENELAAIYGVSRPIVREALGLLREDGRIISRRGAGSFVSARGDGGQDDRPRYAPVGTLADVQRCYEFRLSIEPDNAYFAALRWNDIALDGIARALNLLRESTAIQEHREDADYAFHIAIAVASNNYFHLSSMQALKQHIFVGMRFHGETLLGSGGDLAKVLAEHQGIYDRIAARDAEGARTQLRLHLEGSLARLFDGRLLDLAL